MFHGVYTLMLDRYRHAPGTRAGNDDLRTTSSQAVDDDLSGVDGNETEDGGSASVGSTVQRGDVQTPF